MQKKIQIFILLILIFSTFSCDKDSEVVTDKNKFIVKKIYKNEIQSNTFLREKLLDIKQVNTNKNGKTIYDQNNEFYINTDFANYIEDVNGKHSYTFKIFSPDTQYLLKNLVLSSNDSLGYDLFLVLYDITPNELCQIENGITINIS